MGEERELLPEEEREAIASDEVEGHLLDAGDEREQVAAGDDVEGHLLDPGQVDPGAARSD